MLFNYTLKKCFSNKHRINTKMHQTESKRKCIKPKLNRDRKLGILNTLTEPKANRTTNGFIWFKVINRKIEPEPKLNQIATSKAINTSSFV